MGLEEDARRQISDEERHRRNALNAQRPQATAATLEFVEYARRNGMPTVPVVESRERSRGFGRRRYSQHYFVQTGALAYFVSHFDGEDTHRWAILEDGVAMQCHHYADQGVVLLGHIGYTDKLAKACVDAVAAFLKGQHQ